MGIFGLSLSFYPEWDKVLYHPWSLVTYALPHLNFFHFFGNMCLVYALLPVMAYRLGTRRFLWIYIGGIIAGALTYLLGYQLLGAEIIPPPVAARCFSCHPSAYVLRQSW